jgi:SWI/SNF-related matrix-associated actin-dependent regulator of chromatin subfamily A3
MSVAPLSVLSNWETQVKEHIAPGALTSCTYYGTGRNLSAAELKKYDIIITTYNVVVSEFDARAKHGGGAEPSKKKVKSGVSKTALFEVKWKVRLILVPD